MKTLKKIENNALFGWWNTAIVNDWSEASVSDDTSRIDGGTVVIEYTRENLEFFMIFDVTVTAGAINIDLSKIEYTTKKGNRKTMPSDSGAYHEIASHYDIGEVEQIVAQYIEDESAYLVAA